MLHSIWSVCFQRFSTGLLSLLVGSLLGCGTWPAVGTLHADEGMFPMSELDRISLAERGIRLTAKDLFNPDGISLVDGICRVNGCTGSFVSDSGLIITNHHCAFDAIQKASTPERDLLKNGFIAAKPGDEIPAPDYTVRITESYRDVSAEVLAAAGGLSGSERTKAIDRRRKEVELAAEQQNPGLRAEVAEMFAGRTYVLFLYTFLKDVRLVFAPPAAVGNFGGEADNWEWPRHTGDFSFMRAYTAPDGSSATWSADNVPYRPKRVIRINPAGVQEGDAVFLLGYPGRTARHRTASFLRFEQDVRLPLTVQLYQWQIAEMDRAGKDNREVALKHSSRTKSLANVEKRSRGQLQGLRRAGIVEQRATAEAALQAYIDSDPQRKAKYGSVLSEIDAVYSEMATAGAWEIHLDQLRSACRAAAFAWFVYDAARERQKPDLEREAPYMDRNFEQSVQANRVAMADWHAPTDEILLGGMLERMQSISEAGSWAPLAAAGKTPAEASGLAGTMISRTRMGDPAFVDQCLKMTPAELEALGDPVLDLVIGLYPAWSELRERNKAREGRLGQLYSSLIDIKQEFLATGFVPDANATLRFTSGRVRGYSPADALIKTPISTLQGVIDKTTGVEPFDTPQAVLDRFAARDFGRWVSPQLQQVPVAILYDTDTTGGNSGSPVLDADGALVGVNFDRCFEATINDFAWNTSYSRSIGVDVRYVMWITGTVYGANHLLQEMGVESGGGR